MVDHDLSSARKILQVAAEIGPEDGRDPRFETGDFTQKINNRKALQLCTQVQRILTMVLGEMGDDVLRELWVQSVIPAPNAGCLLVLVSPMSTPKPHDLVKIQARLQAVNGRLRQEVASAIHRRRAPLLNFQIVPAGGQV